MTTSGPPRRPSMVKADDRGRDEEAARPGDMTIDVSKMVIEKQFNINRDGDDDDAMSVTSSYTDIQSSSSSSNDGNGGKDIIGAAESRRVKASRIIMFLILAVFAAGLGTLTWYYTTGQEQQDFEKTFQSQADELIKVSQLNVNSNFEALEALSLTMTTYALGSSSEFPYVTHPNFGAVAETVLENIQGRFVAFLPFVDPAERPKWEEYSVLNQGFVEDAKEYYGLNNMTTYPIVPVIFRLGANNTVEPWTEPLDPEFNYHSPVWQLMPVLEGLQFANFQAWQDPFISRAIKTMVRQRSSVMTELFTSFTYDTASINPWPEAYYMSPVFDDFGPDANLVGLVDTFGEVRLFDNILSDQGLTGLRAVVSNPCTGAFTWQINGPESIYVGPGELVDENLREYAVIENATEMRSVPECPVTIGIYASEEYRDNFHSADPAIFTAATVLIFVITALFFVLYDCLVERRQGKVLNTAKQSGAIVESLFPAGVRERLMENEENKKDLSGSRAGRKMKKLGLDVFESKPIADYYPSATIVVADIANFSAWSSVREPSQVFTLLETLYNSFDVIAKKRRIFKVESMADCYVAACNVPDPRPDHAVAVARFAKDCRIKMVDIVQKLEVFLGPDTSDLRMRFAINTGPVTAGVLRGDKARFQLFGTTMDICFRLEGSGETDEIHVADTTADLIKAKGLESWLTPREEKIVIKGKGETQTYWLDYGNNKRFSPSSEDLMAGPASDASYNNDRLLRRSKLHEDRLVDWNVDTLSRLLKEIVATRQTTTKANENTTDGLKPTVLGDMSTDATVLDEVQEIINVRTEEVSQFDRVDPATIELGPVVIRQLKEYVATISTLYRPNPFHNFEHACHVTQAVVKLLSRVVTPTKIDINTLTYKSEKESGELHQFTFGITSDPTIQFACALSALIHDADHPGVPNSTLVKEESDLAALYKNKSVAEQNSVDLAWELLMEPGYAELRNCIYTNQDELDRFRQLVVNSVMATDIVDKELGAARKSRWNKAFAEDQEDDSITEQQKIQRKATIVIEHLVQAADVSHMMQHWHIYIKWNEKFFRECYSAYLAGRADKNPLDGWYNGELGFYKFYVIPLAKKLETCGVFGVSSDEFLNYAEANYREWQLKGKDMVARYLKNYERDFPPNKNGGGGKDDTNKTESTISSSVVKFADDSDS